MPIEFDSVAKLESWFRENQRSLPWREDRTPYRVWLSEIMLQQTQVPVVVDYFHRFVTRFPTIQDLAAASEDEVLGLWSGLGYYSRARNLHRTAQSVVEHFAGVFPNDPKLLLSLPGVGTYTAGAILSFAFNQAAPVVDGNVSRVLSRVFNDSTIINTNQGKAHFEQISAALAGQGTNPSVLQEGIMELGATICTPKAPDCPKCPLQNACLAYAHGTQNALPRKTPKRARTTLRVACAVIHDDTHLWLEKNERSRLFGGLYQPPHLPFENPEGAKDTMARLLTKLGIASEVTEEPILVKRVLTHRDLFLHGFTFRIQDLPKAHLVPKAKLSQIGISTALRTLFEQTL